MGSILPNNNNNKSKNNKKSKATMTTTSTTTKIKMTTTKTATTNNNNNKKKSVVHTFVLQADSWQWQDKKTQKEINTRSECKVVIMLSQLLSIYSNHATCLAYRKSPTLHPLMSGGFNILSCLSHSKNQHDRL